MVRMVSSQGVGYFSIPSSNVATVLAPTITSVRSASTQNVLFNVANGGSTTSNNLKIYGTASYTGATVSVYLGGVLQGTTTTTVGGNWSFALGPISTDGTYSITAILNYSGAQSPPTPNFTFTINPGLTSLPVSIGSNITDNNTLTWDTEAFTTNSTNQTSGHINNACCIPTDTHTLSMTLLPTDLYSDFGTSNRSEIAFNGRYTDGTTFNITYEVQFSGSSPVNDDFGPGSWCVVGQLHDSGGGGPPYEQNLGGDANQTNQTGDKFNVDYYNGSTFSNIYQGSGNITRGVWHTIDMILKPNGSASTGFIQVWLDGTQILNLTNIVFQGTSPYYWKMGMYRGPTPGEDQNQLYYYRNFLCKRT